MLEIKNVSVSSEGRQIVSGVSFSVQPGQVTALLGANGAGKSELVLGIAGLLPVTAGEITVNGKSIRGAKPDAVRNAGVAAVPEGHQVLGDLTIEDNLAAAASQVSMKETADRLANVYGIFPELSERKTQLAGTLSGGQQQMVALGHALMAKPDYMLIDEMSLGLAPLVVKRLADVVRRLAESGTGILLVEQYVEVALQLACRVVALRKGAVVIDASPEQLRENREMLKRAYL
jgi:branched-chain amino acid transport system ATP-binding protein